jgi:hypothetical protein
MKMSMSIYFVCDIDVEDEESLDNIAAGTADGVYAETP